MEEEWIRAGGKDTSRKLCFKSDRPEFRIAINHFPSNDLTYSISGKCILYVPSFVFPFAHLGCFFSMRAYFSQVLFVERYF